MGDGREHFSGSSYGTDNRLIHINNNKYELQTPNGDVYVYEGPDDTRSMPPCSHLIFPLTLPLKEIRNSRGQTISIGQDSNGNPTITDATGQVSTLTKTDGKITRITDPFGRHADFEYTDNKLTRITDMGGIPTSFGYDDTSGDLTSIENDRGRTEFTYEGGGNPNPDIYPAPGENLGAHRRFTITDPFGHKQEYYYNSLVGYSWYVSPRDYVEYVDETVNNSADFVPKTLYYYEDTGRGPREEINTVLYPEGRQVTTAHDHDTGKILSVSDSFGTTTQFTYNDWGFLTSVTPETGAVTTFTYDPANDKDLVDVNVAGLGSVTMTFNDYNEVTSITDMVGKQIDPIVYNDNGQVTSLTQIHDDHTILTQFAYHGAGQPGADRLASVTKAGQMVLSYTYDTIGRVQTATDASGITLTYGYNDLNHVTQVLYPDGKSINSTYSSCCPRLVDSITNRAGMTTTYAYDALQRLVKVINPEGGISEFEYGPNGNLIGFVNPKHNRTKFAYDLENRLIKRIWTDDLEETYTYDKNGCLVQRTDPRGVRTYYLYDANGNQVVTYYSDNTPWVSYEYDNFNRLIGMVDGLGETSFTYYNDSSLQSVDGPWDNDTLTYTYDKLGRTVGLNPQLGRALSYLYDDLNRITSVQADTRAFSYSFTGADPRIQAITGPEGSQATHEYVDPLKRLTALINTDGTAQTIARFDYAYADAQHPDQISSETVTNGPGLTFSQEGLTSYEHNALEQLTHESTIGPLVYDDAGNLVHGVTPGGQMFTATYDAESRLATIQYTDGGTTYKTEFTYGANSFIGQIKKYENSSLVSDIRIVRDGLLAIQERDGSNQVTREYTWGANMGGGIGGLLNLRQGGMDHTYFYDGKGNVSAILDTTGVIAAAYRYDSFGRVMAQTGTLNQPFQFSTKRYLADTGLNYYGYRFYAPSIGKWLTRDPLGETGGINLYGFVQNNPANFASFAKSSK